MDLQPDVTTEVSGRDAFSNTRPNFAALIAHLWKKRGWILFFLDVAVCLIAFSGAYALRFVYNFPGEDIAPISHSTPEFVPYFYAGILLASIWSFLIWKDQGYAHDFHLSIPIGFEMSRTIVAGIYAMAILMVISFLIRYFLLSRIIYATVFVFVCAMMICLRLCFRVVERYLDDQCFSVYRILLLGWNANVDQLLNRLKERNYCSHLLGRIQWRKGRMDTPADGMPVLGTIDDLEIIYNRTPFDRLLVAGDAESSGSDKAHREDMVRVLNFCEERDISFYMAPDFLDIDMSRTQVGTFAGAPLVLLRDASIHPVYGVLKRLMDIALSVIVIAGGLPLWIIIALLIKLSSKGPVFYTQTRVGVYGKSFPMYKFRSMVESADEQLKDLVDFDNLKDPVFNIRDDPRVTRVGRFLRRTSIDEIPQTINVLLGQMSFIGPRPERVELVERYQPWQRRRLKGKPGITGYQQVMSRGDPSLAKRIEYDLYYLKHQGLFLDLFILFKTVVVIIRGDGMN